MKSARLNFALNIAYFVFFCILNKKHYENLLAVNKEDGINVCVYDEKAVQAMVKRGGINSRQQCPSMIIVAMTVVVIAVKRKNV